MDGGGHWGPLSYVYGYRAGGEQAGGGGAGEGQETKAGGRGHGQRRRRGGGGGWRVERVIASQFEEGRVLFLGLPSWAPSFGISPFIYSIDCYPVES